MKGRLITVEGGEGAGKTTVLNTIEACLRERGVDLLRTREPGGTELAEAIRALMLDPRHRHMCAEAELLLVFAGRAQHVREVIQPALAAGRWILSDRYVDASYAYQGGGRGLDRDWIADLDRRTTLGIAPDLTLLLDLDPAIGRSRQQQRGPGDRIEREVDSFFERVRDAYLERAASHPQRYRVIDASAAPAQVAAAAWAEVERLCDGS
mgnify:CR=1 FL=1